MIDLMAQAGDGLDHAHSKGLVHRDVKPRNCMMTADGTLKVTDFGLTKREGSDADAEGGTHALDEDTSVPVRETVTAAGMGTPGYMAPEMWVPGSEVGREADIYAFGVMFYEICCGRKPFVLPVGESLQKLGVAHIKKRPPPPSSLRRDMPPQLERVILRCLAKKPDDRYHSFLEMRRELEGIYKELFRRRYARERPDEVRLISDALNNRAVSLMDLNHEDEAETTLTSALQSDPHHAEAVYNLGLLGWMRTGNPDWDVVVRMEEVVKTPQYAGRGSHLLGRLLLALGDASRALKASEQSLTSENASEEWLKPQGVALIGVGRDKEAVNGLETYLAEFPDDDEAVGWLVGALIRSGKTDRAVARLQGLPSSSELSGATVGAVARDYRYSGLDEILKIPGHAGWITCVNHFPRSALLVSGTRDRTLKVWDAHSGEERKSVPLVGEPPGMLCISPDERLVAIAASQKAAAVKILDLESTRFIGNLLAQDIVTAMEFSPEGKTVITVENRGLVRVWDAKDFKVVSSFKIPTHAAAAIVFEGPSKPVIFFGGLDRVVKRIRPGEPEAESFEREHREPITILKVSPDGTRVLSCGRDRLVIAWDATNGSAVSTFQIHQEQIAEIALNPHRDLAASYDPKAGIKVWDTRTGLVFRTFAPGDADMLCMGFTPDGTRLLAGGRDMTLRVWDVRGRQFLPVLALAQIRPLTKQIKSDRKFKAMIEEATKAMKRGAFGTAYSMLQDSRLLAGYERSDTAMDLIMRMREHGTRTGLRGGWNRRTLETNSAVMDVRFSPTAINIVTAQADHTLRLWSARTGDCLKILRGHTNLVTSVRFAGNGREAVSGSDDRTVRTWDVTTGRNLLALKGHQDSVSSVNYSPDGTCIASGSWDGTVKVWRLPEGGLFKTLKADGDKIASIAWIGTASERLVSAGYSGVVRMWDVTGGRLLRELKGHKDRITDLVVSANGDLLWTVSADGTAREWDLRLGREVRVVEVCQAGLRAVDLSPDGSFVAAGGIDGVLRVWGGETGKGLRDFQGHAKEITANTFSSNARFIASSSLEGSVMVWELDWDWRFSDKKTLQNA
jgi:WD40 repeat protein